MAWLLRRLPIIAGEEAWPVLGVVTTSVRELQGGSLLSAAGIDRVIGLLQGIARLEKDKDADGFQALHASADCSWRTLVDSKTLCLTEEVLGTQKKRAALTSLQGWTWHKNTRAILEAIEYRYPKGALEGDLRLLLAAGVLATANPEYVVQTTQRFDPTCRLVGEVPPPWTARDMHTGVGKRAMYYVAKCLGMPPAHLSTLWFLLESGAVDRTAPESVWWARWMDWALGDIGFESVEAARARWLEIAPLVERIVKRFSGEAAEEYLPHFRKEKT
jgi:hypothetical protein